MGTTTLPAGLYFSLSGEVTAGTGGQTRALLMRNRMFLREAGISPIILTLDAEQHYPQVREQLRAQGQLVDGIELLNIYEWYRDADLETRAPTGELLPDISGMRPVDTLHPDGTVASTTYVHPRAGSAAVKDHRRPDGTVYLREPTGPKQRRDPATQVLLANRRGEVVGSWPDLVGWRRQWLRDLNPQGQRSFVISDSRYAINDALPAPVDTMHVIYVLHNTHTEDAWFSPVWGSFKPVLGSLDDLDALVTLTERQRDDIAVRFGERTNLFVVPNPVESPRRPDPLPERARARFAMVARLERQKQIEHAIRAFALVLKEEPDATLDIYGDGTRELELKAEISANGVDHAVQLRGHDPRAREALWTATGFVVSSRFEGYPLATLEALSHGCPVIGYDVRYGLREQVSDGVDGLLVPPGDTSALADRIVRLIRDPELVARMSAAAFVKAAQHDHEAFLGDWKRVLTAVVEQRPDRTSLTSVRLKVDRLGYVRRAHLPVKVGPVRLPARLTRVSSWSATFRHPPRLALAGRLLVDGSSERASLDDAVVTLTAVSPGADVLIPVPLQVTRCQGGFHLEAEIDTAELIDRLGSARTLKLRLRLVWNNSSWETMLARSPRFAPRFEVTYADRNELTLVRRPPG